MPRLLLVFMAGYKDVSQRSKNQADKSNVETSHCQAPEVFIKYCCQCGGAILVWGFVAAQ